MPLIVLSAKSAFEQQKYHDAVATVNALLETTDTVAVYARLLGASYFQLHEYKKVISQLDISTVLKAQADCRLDDIGFSRLKPPSNFFPGAAASESSQTERVSGAAFPTGKKWEALRENSVSFQISN